MDTELIKMCDVPEIQDRWEPKRGDQMWTKWGEDILIITVLPINPDYDRKMYIYIPRIEDVIAMVITSKMWFLKLDHIRELIAINSWYDDKEPVMAFIRAYMHLEHGKTWNGEEWA